MKAAIICFSQTGNTRKIAEKICDGLLGGAEQCDLIKMEAVDPRILDGYDLIGLGCPAFYCKEPFNVQDFIEALPPQNNRRWFVFCTHGAVMGQTLFSMAQRLTKKGAVVIGSHHTYADITIPFYPSPTLTSGHPDDQDLQEAFDFGRAMAECSIAVSRGETRRIVPPSQAPEHWARHEADTLTRQLLSKVMPRFTIDGDKCIQCGECQDACPVGGIDIHADPIRIQSPCIYCLHCASICPTCAIQADWRRLVKMAPANYARYRAALNDAAKRGEFRWRIDPDTVDCSHPLYMQREREVNPPPAIPEA